MWLLNTHGLAAVGREGPSLPVLRHPHGLFPGSTISVCFQDVVEPAGCSDSRPRPASTSSLKFSPASGLSPGPETTYLISFLNMYFHFMWRGVLLACLSVHHVCATLCLYQGCLLLSPVPTVRPPRPFLGGSPAYPEQTVAGEARLHLREGRTKALLCPRVISSTM